MRMVQEKKKTARKRNRRWFPAFFAVCIFAMFAGCGNDSQKDAGGPQVSMDELKTAMLAADTTLPEMVTVDSEEENAELNFSYLADLDYALVDSYFYSYAKDGTAEEIVVVRMKDRGDVAGMMDALHGHTDQRRGTFEEYAPEQVQMLERAVVTREGNYVTLIICTKNGLVQDAFKKCFQSDQE